MASLTDERGKTTAFVFDELNRRISRTNPLMETVIFGYDSRDNLTSVLDVKMQSFTNVYDALNRLKQVITPDNVINLDYDPVGNLTVANDNDSDLSFTYDELNRPKTADTLAGGIQPLVTLTSDYNVLRQRELLSDSLGGATSYLFDPVGRLERLTSPSNDILDFGYDPSGRLTNLTRPNGIDTTHQYDPIGRLQSLVHGSAALDIATYAYQYDALGNIAEIDEGLRVKTFTYDALERLTAVNTNGAPTESYQLDEIGNRQTSHRSNSHLLDDANRLLGDEQFSYIYDANGNLTSKTELATTDTTTYDYNAQNQLIRIDFPDLTFAEYKYDALGRRIQKDVNGTVTQYLYDGEDILLEFDGAAALTARFTHGAGTDQPLVMERGGVSYFFHVDHLGSIRKVTDDLGNVVNEYDYDAYGNFEFISETVTNPYGFTGREYDAESGLYYYRARYYDTNTRRFLQADSLGFAAGDTNLYNYVFNNPNRYRDPTGLFCIESEYFAGIISKAVGGAVAGGIIGAAAGPKGAAAGALAGGVLGAASGILPSILGDVFAGGMGGSLDTNTGPVKIGKGLIFGVIEGAISEGLGGEGGSLAGSTVAGTLSGSAVGASMASLGAAGGGVVGAFAGLSGGLAANFTLRLNRVLCACRLSLSPFGGAGPDI